MVLLIFLMKIKSAAMGKAMSTKVSGGWATLGIDMMLWMP